MIQNLLLRGIVLDVKKEINQLLPKKIIVAAITSVIIALLLGIYVSITFNDANQICGFETFFLSAAAFIMYSYPVILIYGTFSSTISDVIARLLSKNFSQYVSVVFHLAFAFILLPINLSFFWVSLLASALFFSIDRFIGRKTIYKWKQALKSIGIPLLSWITFMGIVYLIGLVKKFFTAF